MVAFPSPEHLPNSGAEPASPVYLVWQADSLPLNDLGSPVLSHSSSFPLYRKLKARCWQGWFSSKGSTREGFTFLPVWLLGSLQLPMIIELTASVFGGERPPSSIKGHPQFSVTQASKTWPTASSRLEREDLERVCWQGGISCNTT